MCIYSGTDDDLEYYVRECGEILGVSNKLQTDKRDAKHILEYVMHQVMEFKKLNQVSRTSTTCTSSCISLGMVISRCLSALPFRKWHNLLYFLQATFLFLGKIDHVNYIN